jgi:hypothetical protein
LRGWELATEEMGLRNAGDAIGRSKGKNWKMNFQRRVPISLLAVHLVRFSNNEYLRVTVLLFSAATTYVKSKALAFCIQ